MFVDANASAAGFNQRRAVIDEERGKRGLSCHAAGHNQRRLPASPSPISLVSTRSSPTSRQRSGSAPARPDGSGWRVGSSSKIWRNGGWYDHKLKVPGRGALSYVRHYRNCSVDEAIAWARDWLAQHPDTGPCTGNDDSDETSDDEVERTTYITSLYDSGHPIEHTPAWDYLCGREIDPAKLPPALVAALRWLPNMRGEEGWLLSPFTDEVGTITALHITHITPQGELSKIEPRRIVNRGPANWSSTSLLRYDSGIGSEFVVAEGLEDFLSVVLAGCPRAAGVGNVGAFGRVRLPYNVESVVIARDGDDPVTKRDADQALHRGIARYLGQKLAVRITATPIGMDPNDILRSAGADGLKALIEDAQPKLGRFDHTGFREELYRLDDLAWGWARKAPRHCSKFRLRSSTRTARRRGRGGPKTPQRMPQRLMKTKRRGRSQSRISARFSTPHSTSWRSMSSRHEPFSGRWSCGRCTPIASIRTSARLQRRPA